MDTPYVHEDVRLCNRASLSNLNSLLLSVNAKIDSSGKLQYASQITDDDIVDIPRIAFQLQRSNTFLTNLVIGYWWISVSNGRYGSRKELLIKAFGEKSYERMYALCSTRATVCRKWDGKWDMSKPWEWHRLGSPDDPCVSNRQTEADYCEVMPEHIMISGESISTGEEIEIPLHKFDGIRAWFPHPTTGELVEVIIRREKFTAPIMSLVRHNKMEELAIHHRQGRIKLPTSGKSLAAK